MSSVYNGEAPSKLIEDALKFVMVGIGNNMDRYQRNASGASVRKMKIVMESPDHGYLASPNFSFRVMERGRKMGKVPHGFVDIIKKWIIDKGIPIHTSTAHGYDPTSFDKQAKRMAGAIAHSIMQNGTRLHRNSQFDDIFTTNINVATARLGTQLMNWTSVTIDKILQQ